MPALSLSDSFRRMHLCCPPSSLYQTAAPCFLLSAAAAWGLPAKDSTLEYEVDVRYMGQGMTMPLRLGSDGRDKARS